MEFDKMPRIMNNLNNDEYFGPNFHFGSESASAHSYHSYPTTTVSMYHPPVNTIKYYVVKHSKEVCV